MLPRPPADLGARPLPRETLGAGTVLHRIHAPAYGPVFFGPGAGRPPTYRFDDPAGAYGVCYLGRRPLAAFVETFLRDLPVRFVSERNLAARAISAVRVTRPLRVVRAHGRGLVRLGTTAALAGARLELPGAAPTRGYAHAQAWSRALHDHPDAPAGIAFRSSHDDDLLCLALFGDRAADALEAAGPPEPLAAAHPVVSTAIARYGLLLLPAFPGSDDAPSPVTRQGSER